MAPTATNVWSKSPGSHYPSNIHSNCPDTSVAKIPHSPPLYFSSFPVTTKFSRPHLLMTWPRKLSCLWRTVAQCSIQHNQLSMTTKKRSKNSYWDSVIRMQPYTDKITYLINIWMPHLTQETYTWWWVRVVHWKLHNSLTVDKNYQQIIA